MMAMDEPTCRICGHDAEHHKFRAPEPVCTKCPDQTCQDGPDGDHYRRTRIH